MKYVMNSFKFSSPSDQDGNFFFGEMRLEREANSCWVLDVYMKGLLDIQVNIVSWVAVDTYFKFTG